MIRLVKNLPGIRRFMRSGHAYEEIHQLLRTVQPKGLCLDFPAGKGVNIIGIRQAGFIPIAADLFSEETKHSKGLKLTADFNDNLPFADNSFAALLCSEGIEHCPKQLELIREFHRVLKPGGHLVITTPNTLNFRARLASMLNGQSSFARSPITELTQIWKESASGRLYLGHVFLLSYFQLRFILKIIGFSNIRISTAKYSTSATLLAPLLWLPVWVGTQGIFRKQIREMDKETVKEIISHVLSTDLLLGKKLIIAAEKTRRTRLLEY